MTKSLRFRLIAGTLVIVTAIWLAVSLSAWREARHEAEELFDAHLAQTGALLAAFVGGDEDWADEIGEHLPDHHYARKVAFQIWEGGTRLRVHSAAAPETRLSPVDRGFSDSDGWRVYSLWDEDGRNLIQVAETREARRDVSRQLAEHLLAPLVVALPLLAAALVLLIRGSLAPLDRIAASIASRTPDRLDAIPVEDSPRELHPILGRLNDLLARIAHSLEQERRFTADAAHELRTPLAAMRAHAQVAQGARDAGERDAALARVIEATDRATRLVGQLLTLAHLDADALTGRFAPCGLRGIAAETLALLAPSALSKNIELILTDGPEVEVRGERTLLAVLLRNLVDNALRYSPPGTAVTAAIDCAAIEVIDQGPGIPPDERTRVLDRFHRLAGGAGNEDGGAGLGLSIAAKIAELHGARIELTDGPGGRGLRARVVFPPISSAGMQP
ncbi:MAG: ATP-binding protein [Rhodocyclaceae bacterium]|nr:ATP-binding protein [Rhodocyclaceae bacterium]